MFVGCGCHCNKFDTEQSRSFQSRSSLSGSLRSFGSSIADPGGTYPVYSCSACLSGVAPTAYQFAWDYNGEPGTPDDPRPCCPAYRSFKTIKVTRRSFKNENGNEDPNYCWYQSAEPARMAILDYRPLLFFPTWSCVSEDPEPSKINWLPLAELEINIAPSETVPRPVVRIWFLTRFVFALPPEQNKPQIINGWHYAKYELVVPPGESWIENFQWQVPCLRPLDFRLVDIQNPQNFDQDLGPGWQGTGFSPLHRAWVGAPCRQLLFSGFDEALPRSITLVPVGA